MPMRTRSLPLASLRVSITGSRPSWVRTWADKSACIRSRRSCSRREQLGDTGNFVRAEMNGFRCLNLSYARSTCEVVGFRLYLDLARFRTIQVCPKDLRELPVHPEPAVSWHSGFRGGAHVRPKTTPVHHAARRRS